MKRAESIPTLDDIIFEKRNKLYGAYELRRNYHRRLNKSLAISVSVLFSVFLLFILTKKEVQENLFQATKDKVVFADNFTVQQYNPPEKSSSQPLSEPDEHAFVAVKDTVVNQKPVDTLLTTVPAGIDTAGGFTGSGHSSDTIVSQPFLPSDSSPKSMATVDKVPEFPGGLEKFYKYLTNRLRYTEEARRAAVKGKLYVRFVIDEEGLVRNVTLMSKIGYGLDEQVEGVLAQSPKWMPGLLRNSAVKTEMILPVSFNIR